MASATMYRVQDGRVLAGVCTGLSEHLRLPVNNVRLTLVLLSVLGAFGIVLYCWLWVFVPQQDNENSPVRRALTKPHTTGQNSEEAKATVETNTKLFPVPEFLLGTSLLVVGVGFVLLQAGVSIDLPALLAALAVLVGVGLAWWQIADRNKLERTQVPRILGALALVAIGILMFFITASEPSALTVITAAFAVLAGTALALAPWLLRINHDLVSERSARARESERADIAAHLHDSVLQTLAAIQQRSEPDGEIARLARVQERELRDWLFREGDISTEFGLQTADVLLREHAYQVEEIYPVHFEIVTVGAQQVAAESIIAAAREAMLNAAKYAGGTVTVFAESTPVALRIDITDRGMGFDLDDLPEGRGGVREAILGRMERAGGKAQYRAGPGGYGTAVRLSLPYDAQRKGS